MKFDDFFSDMHSLLTVISLITFVGIVIWAWSARRSRAFREAEMLPFADEAPQDDKAEKKTEKKTEMRDG